MIHLVAEDSIDWASIATECQNSRIVDAEDVEVKWAEAWGAKYPLKIYPQRNEKFDIRKTKNIDWFGTKIKFDFILSIVSEKTGCHKNLIIGKSRAREIAKIRHLLCWLAYQYFGYSLSDIGRLIANRDHTTVLNSIKQFERILEYDRKMIVLKDQCIQALDEKIINAHINQQNGWILGDRKPDVNVIVNAAFQEAPLEQITLSKALFDGKSYIDRHGNAIEGRFLGWRP
jgi:hypothetical protein